VPELEMIASPRIGKGMTFVFSVYLELKTLDLKASSV
jgi:hypothetical protein